MKLNVAVEGMEFFAYHGFYDAEQRTGHTYLIDVNVDVAEDVAGQVELSDSINYEEIYSITHDVMQIKERLLETVGQKIIGTIQSRFPHSGTIKVVIRKCMPQLGGKVKYAVVELTS